MTGRCLFTFGKLYFLRMAVTSFITVTYVYKEADFVSRINMPKLAVIKLLRKIKGKTTVSKLKDVAESYFTSKLN